MKTNWTTHGIGWLWLAAAGLAAQPASAQSAQQMPASATAPRASISAVEIAQTGPQTTVRVSGAGELHFQVSRLDSPPRLVLDFADTSLQVAKYKVLSPYPPVQDVRMGQPNPNESRVVIDLAKAVPFTSQGDGSNVTIFFTTPAALATPAALQPASRRAQHKLTAVKEPNMPLPAWLTGQDMGFARPADEPAAPAAPPAAQNTPVAVSRNHGSRTGKEIYGRPNLGEPQGRGFEGFLPPDS